MTKLTKSAVENFAIKLFEQLGYGYVYAPDIAPDGENPERSHYDEVILKDRLPGQPCSASTPLCHAMPCKKRLKTLNAFIRRNCKPIMKPFIGCSPKA